MDIPEYLYVHCLIVEPFLGNSSHGPEYGAELIYPAFIDDTTTLQLNREGQEVVSSSKAYVPLTATVPLESRAIPLYVKKDYYTSLDAADKLAAKESSRDSLVLDRKRRDGGGLPTPDHLEVILR